MKQLRYVVGAVIVLSLLFMVLPQPALASIDIGALDQAARADYIGPASGTLIAQVLIGLAVGGAAMLMVYRARAMVFLKNLFNKRRGDKESEEGEPAE